MRTTRRELLAGGVLLLGLAGAGPAVALTEEEARRHVRAAVDDVLALVQSGEPPEAMAPELRGILERHAAMPQIARFAAGRAWREMTDGQQERFTEAFSAFLSRTYAQRFQEYSGETVSVGEVVDGGRKGLLVKSRVTQQGGEPVAVDWLVSDRPGRTVIADIVIEGVSLLITQREEVGAMLEKRNGDIDKLIADLQTS